MQKQWSIEARTYDLNLGFLDKLDHLFSHNYKEIGHSYLALVDENGDVVSRIDGMAYDDGSRKTAEYSRGFSAYFSTFASSLGLSKAFDRVAKSFGYDVHFPRLRTLITDGTHFRERENEEHIAVARGDQSEILQRWLAACEHTKALNNEHMQYVPASFSFGWRGITQSGQNCHSVSSDLLQAMGLNVSQDIFVHHAVPGFQEDLVESEDFKLSETVNPCILLDRLEEYMEDSRREYLPAEPGKGTAGIWIERTQRQRQDCSVIAPAFAYA